MSTPIVFNITPAGLTAALDAENNGLSLKLNRFGVGTGHLANNNTTLANQWGDFMLAAAGIEVNSKTLRFTVIVSSAFKKDVSECCLYTDGGVVFATAKAAGSEPLFTVYPDIDFIAAFGLVLSPVNPNSIQVVVDTNAALALSMLNQHVIAANPHPQYTQNSVFNAHVAQNQLEHNNILALIAAEAQTRLQHDDDLTGDVTALAESAQNQINALAAQIAAEIIARQLGDSSLNAKIDQQFDFYGNTGSPTIYPLFYAAHGRSSGQPVNYTTLSYSVYVMPKGLLKQTVQVRTTAKDGNLHIYLPIAAKQIWHIASNYQSIGRSASSPPGDDDSTSRILNIYEEDAGNNKKQTVIIVRSDRIGNTEDYDGERFIWLEVTCSEFNLPGYLQDAGNYPYPRTV